MSGILQPGAIVRAETIGEELGISATPAREALQMLKIEGFLNKNLWQGYEVAPLIGKDIRDLFTAQALIAGELSARAASIATDAELSELGEVHEQLIAGGVPEQLEASNHRFHRAVNMMARSPRITRVLALLTRYVPRSFHAETPGWNAVIVTDHGLILTALRSGDEDSARSAMHDHIIRAGAMLADHFDARARCNNS